LTTPFPQVYTKLRDQRVRDCELGDGKGSQRELADTDETDAELSDADDAAGELPDRDNSSRYNRGTVGPILKRDMN
jgi:hypothetical protein